MHCHDRLFYSFQSRCTWPHCIPDVPISPLTVNRIFPDQAKNPKKGPKLFMESDIKISRTQNIDRSTKGAYTFSSGLGGSQRPRSIMHIIPVSVHKSCLAAFLTPPPYKNINQSCSDMMTRAAPATECGRFRVWVISQPVEGTPLRLMRPVSQSGDSVGFGTSKEKHNFFPTTFNSLTHSEVVFYMIFCCLASFFS